VYFMPLLPYALQVSQNSTLLFIRLGAVQETDGFKMHVHIYIWSSIHFLDILRSFIILLNELKSWKLIQFYMFSSVHKV